MGAQKLYAELAQWWPLMSPVAHYEEEASSYYAHMISAIDGPGTSLLELGCGGGNAWYMKQHFSDVVLTDLSPGMRAISRELNPDCTHVLGDMRTLRLGRQFDCVFVHDAVCYMTSDTDLRQAIETARCVRCAISIVDCVCAIGRIGIPSVNVEHDRHIEGLFGRDHWLGKLRDVGFEPSCVPFDHSDLDPGSTEVFVARRPHR